MLLALDPSSNRCGVALFHEGKLVVAAYVAVPRKAKVKCPFGQAVMMSQLVVLWCADYKISEMVVEWPKIRSATNSKGDPNHNVPLAGVCGGVAIGLGLSLEHCHGYLPKEWTGGDSKDESTVAAAKTSPRALKTKRRLKGAELDVWDKAKYHDTIDAIGIGLKFLGRFERLRRPM